MAQYNMDEIYRQNAQLVYRYLFSLCRDADLAEDLTQQTFYEALRSVKQYRGDAALSTYLCGIARNLLNKELSRRAARPTVPLDESLAAAAESDPETQTLEQSQRQALFQRIHALPPQMREVVYLRLSGELSFREIGDILQKSETWARVTFYRAKVLLQKGGEP